MPVRCTFKLKFANNKHKPSELETPYIKPLVTSTIRLAKDSTF